MKEKTKNQLENQNAEINKQQKEIDFQNELLNDNAIITKLMNVIIQKDFPTDFCTFVKTFSATLKHKAKMMEINQDYASFVTYCNNPPPPQPTLLSVTIQPSPKPSPTNQINSPSKPNANESTLEILLEQISPQLIQLVFTLIVAVLILFL